MNKENFNSVLTNGDVYQEISEEDSLKCQYQAVHCCIFARAENPEQHAVLMQVRSDGTLGFPGGIVDEGECTLEALNRELYEELNLDLSNFSVISKNHLVSHHIPPLNRCFHFYAKEVTMVEFSTIEQNAYRAKHFGIEVFGIFRVPLLIFDDGCRGLPEFLKNRFIGNARDQLLYTLGVHSLLPVEEILKAVKAGSRSTDVRTNYFF